MKALEPGALVQANAVAMVHEAVEGWQRVSGDPSTANVPLGVASGTEFGLWEMTSGTMLDEEINEVFLIITGTATVEFLAPEHPPIHLTPGSIVRLSEGMATRWTVTSEAPLRKLYLASHSGPNPLPAGEGA